MWTCLVLSQVSKQNYMTVLHKWLSIESTTSAEKGGGLHYLYYFNFSSSLWFVLHHRNWYAGSIWYFSVIYFKVSWGAKIWLEQQGKTMKKKYSVD